MATRNISPRADGEGSLGRSGKKWGNIYADNAHIAGRDIAEDGAKLDANSSAIDSLRNAVGSPLVANSVLDMTDINKIYVYTGNEQGYTKGNWYYYNGSAWVSGGVYNSTAFETDKTLTIEGAAADAKAAGDWLRDIAVPVTALPDVPDTDFANEYAYVMVDHDKRMLFGVKHDGTVDWQKGTPQHVIEACNPTMDNPEWLYLIKAPDDRVLFGIKRDGTVDWQKGTPEHVIEACNPTINNDEYAYVMLDSDQRVLFGVKKDGSVDWQKGTPQHVIDACNPSIENPEFVQLTQDSEGRLIEGIRTDGKKVFFSQVLFQNNESNIYEKYPNLAGKYVSIMGDSISTYQGTSDKYFPPYYPNAGYGITSVDDMWWMQTINHFGMNLLKNVSISTTQVTGDSTINTNRGTEMPGCCDYRVAELADHGVAPDIVLIYMGVNDTGKAGLTITDIEPGDEIVAEGNIIDFAKAYDLMLYKIKQAYPNATVYCSNLPWFTFTNPTFPYKRDNGISMTMQNKAILEACQHIGAHYVDFYASHRASQSRFDWDIHLTKAGMTLLANAFIKKIESTY